MDFMIVLFVLLHINLAVPKCIFLDVLTMKGILFIAMSIASAMFPYLLIISLGTLSHVVHTCSVGCLVVFPFNEPKLGQNMSSAHIMSCLVVV